MEMFEDSFGRFVHHAFFIKKWEEIRILIRNENVSVDNVGLQISSRLHLRRADIIQKLCDDLGQARFWRLSPDGCQSFGETFVDRNQPLRRRTSAGNPAKMNIVAIHDNWQAVV